MAEDNDPDETPDSSGGPNDEPESEPTKPTTVPVASRAAQLGTIGVALVVLVVVAVAWFFQRGDQDPTPPDASASSGSSGTSGATKIPQEPSASFEPTRNEKLPEIPDVPASLCPELTLRTPITVVTLNIHSGQAGQRNELGRVGAAITSWKPDVVLLQEVDDNRRGSGRVDQAKALGKMTDLSSVYGGNQFRPDGGPIGNAILSKYPVVKWSNIALPKAGGKQNRGLLHAVLDVKGTEISFYSVHFDHKSSGARLAQARAVVAQFAKDPRPKIMGGDLNAGPGSAPVSTLRSSGLGDAWAVGSGSGKTAPAGRPRYRIDFLLHDGLFRPLQTVVLSSGVSDHRAVWTRIEFREELECFKVGGD
ncbi:MAG: endonuclease/exonuclease/phosphatase family protein [Nocardioidaceae bacterium]|nr:endonuclease/exonuclease/phosphatase family protein [Nocardioidaceae bacterium]